jgi:hypothetical protein
MRTVVIGWAKQAGKRQPRDTHDEAAVADVGRDLCTTHVVRDLQAGGAQSERERADVGEPDRIAGRDKCEAARSPRGRIGPQANRMRAGGAIRRWRPQSPEGAPAPGSRMGAEPAPRAARGQGG